ncbi:MAG: hypothetical protein ACN4GW_13960 [Desulforhopalus sp.]
MTFSNFLLRLTLILLLLNPLMVDKAEAIEVPHSVGGIALGTSIDSYPDLVRTNFLKEVVVTNRNGFRKGVISYGACLHKDVILKIDMKYKDKSKKFYKKLLKEFRQNFGEPTSWEGDSFGVLYLWKWRFTDKDGNRVSLALQYNGKNSHETIGNIVKISYPEKIEEERLCFIDMCDQINEERKEDRKPEQKEEDWSSLIPQ